MLVNNVSKSVSEMFKGIPNNHGLSQSQQQTYATDIQEGEIRISIMSMSWRYYWKTAAYTQISRSKINLIQNYTESTLRKLLCKPKDRAAAENKNNIVYEPDW